MLLFVAIGLLYGLFTLIIEHFFWLNPFGRTLLFWCVVGFEAFLFYRLIFIPLAKYFKIQKGIDNETASKIVGKHFPEVKDKLLNVLQLNQQSQHTEFLLASIEQKSKNLSLVPFKNAVNLKDNLKYLRYAVVPILIVFVFFMFGKQAVFTDSLKRVVNYQTTYFPPAPFSFFVMNNPLEAIENTSFTLVVKTVGSVIPEEVQIVYDNASYILNQPQLGVFEHEFRQLKAPVNFTLIAGDVISKPYHLDLINTPVLLHFDLYLDYPTYTGKTDQKIANNGNATIPEGTKLRWELTTKSTDSVVFAYKDKALFFEANNQKFQFSKQLFESLSYTIQTSNAQLKNYENLAFTIQTIKDQRPTIKVEMKQDSTYQETLFFYGQISDDYGINSLKLHYYPMDDPTKSKSLLLPADVQTFQEFTYAFPSNLELIEDTAYALYFEVFDDDPFHQNKSTRSRVFNYNSKSQNTLEELQLQEQNELSTAFQKALNSMAEQDQSLKELSQNQKQTPQLNFSDQQKLKSFLERQKVQDQMLKKFNNKMKKNLNQFNKSKKKDPFKEQLEKRLDAQKETLKKDEKLLEELKKVTDKINKEQLAEKLEELAKQNKNKQRSLEQLLELTKRYYVTKKAEQLQEALNKLSEAQSELSKESSEQNSKSAQDQLNDDFKDLLKQLNDLKKDNEALSKPLSIPDDPNLEKSIQKDQENASEDLGKKEKSSNPQDKTSQLSKAQKSQRKAAQKMRQMGKKMSSQMGSGSAEQLNEDVEMLRQILDNLLLFSFDQEALMNRFKTSPSNNNDYAQRLVKQSNLREHFEHVDDSLFALSLRQPKISEQVNSEITDVFFNIDKSLELLSENDTRKGVSAQQFAVSSTNKLADLLSNTLNSMQMEMQLSPGQGEGEMQLPDIIMSQEALNKEMEKQLNENGKKPNGEKQGSEKGKADSNKDSGEGDSSSKPVDDGAPGDEGQRNSAKPSGLGGDSEGDTGELFEIFKKQQELRNALQELLDKKGIGQGAQNLLNAMEKIEQNLINQGVTSKSLQDMKALKHQLLKLEKAALQQGEDTKRVADTSKADRFQSPAPSPEVIKQYFNTTEILNRQSLPLRQEFKQKVQEYFKNPND